MSGKSSPSEILIGALLDQPDLKVLDSDDAEEVKNQVGLSFKPHELEWLRAAGAQHSRLHQFSLAALSVHRLRYGGEVRVDPDRLEEFFLVQMPITGGAEIICDNDSILTGSGKGVIISPTQQLRMHYYDDCDQLMLRIDRVKLEQLCSRHLGHPLKQPLVFKSGFNWLEIPAWRYALEYITRLQKESPDSLQQPLILTQLEELLIATLLSEQPHNYSEPLADERPQPVPRHVKRVEEYIQAHADQPLTPSDLADIAGVSVRSLYYGFQEFRQTGPMEYLRNVRLQRVRKALMAPTSTLTVTAAASRWGFSHMSRFSQAYQQLFGEKPSETLRKARS
ncbi:AraC family transcriptional regulator [Marinobacterium sp. YM272]|uniref:AraC family transcriptional regulator n=1 Tax=Marinobacterium sp. YM272 TaxID=3421654 RepID=UPI003D7FC8EC